MGFRSIIIIISSGKILEWFDKINGVGSIVCNILVFYVGVGRKILVFFFNRN